MTLNKSPSITDIRDMHTTLATLGRVHGASPVESMKMPFESFRNRGLGWDPPTIRHPPAGMGGPTEGFIIMVNRRFHHPPAGLGGPTGGIIIVGEWHASFSASQPLPVEGAGRFIIVVEESAQDAP